MTAEYSDRRTPAADRGHPWRPGLAEDGRPGSGALLPARHLEEMGVSFTPPRAAERGCFVPTLNGQAFPIATRPAWSLTSNRSVASAPPSPIKPESPPGLSSAS